MFIRLRREAGDVAIMSQPRESRDFDGKGLVLRFFPTKNQGVHTSYTVSSYYIFVYMTLSYQYCKYYIYIYNYSCMYIHIRCVYIYTYMYVFLFIYACIYHFVISHDAKWWIWVLGVIHHCFFGCLFRLAFKAHPIFQPSSACSSWDISFGSSFGHILEIFGEYLSDLSHIRWIGTINQPTIIYQPLIMRYPINWRWIGTKDQKS